MNLPGFTAGQSLGRGTASYGTRNSWVRAQSGGIVVPMLYSGTKCCPPTDAYPFGDCDSTFCASASDATLSCDSTGKANLSCNGCFLTTACVSSREMPDDCFELKTLRKFRDEYLLRTDRGLALVDDYYRMAPAICEKISARADSAFIYDYLYSELVLGTINLIQRNDQDLACRHYQGVVLELQQRLRFG